MVQRPADCSKVSPPGELKRVEPPSWSVFQGVPMPRSSELGHEAVQPGRGSSSIFVWFRPGCTRRPTTPLRQHSWRRSMRRPPSAKCSTQ
jgi:hypothetical protein